jgi:hypothetical protein
VAARLGKIGRSTGHGASTESGVRGSDSDGLSPVELGLRSEEWQEVPRPIGEARFVSSISERHRLIGRSRCGPLQDWSESTEAVASLSCQSIGEGGVSKQSLVEMTGSPLSELDLTVTSSARQD